MLRNILFWILAVIITVAALGYQRKTGPTYPADGSFALGGKTYEYSLTRSHDIGDAPVELVIPDPNVRGALVFKRFKVSEAWTEIPMQRQGDRLTAALPHQPPAGKLEYFLRLSQGEETITVPSNEDIVIRFKGHVPVWILAPHILLITLAMLLSTRAGLEALPSTGKPRLYAYWAAGLLFVAGMIFGPLVQRFAFGALWTGIPFGWDLTDNKTLIAMIGWAVAVWALSKGRRARAWVIMAAFLLLLVFSIPHSMAGSELNYETGRIGAAGVGR